MEWQKAAEDSQNKKNINSFGDAVAPVANCYEEKYGSQVKEEMSVKEFCGYWKNRSEGDNNSTQILYLKDWHFCKIFPTCKAYETPVYFKSDWLNEFWDRRSDVSDDYRFVYMGPKGSWSYSWSANICGCKKWLIYPPGQEKYLTDRLGNLAYDITSDDMNDRYKFPEFDTAVKPLIVIQREGEVIFVPSGWHHQVINLEDTISINHNWTNACGISKMWEHLKGELVKVILRASCGINYEEFVEFLDSIAKQRIGIVKGKKTVTPRELKDMDSEACLTEKGSEISVFQDWSRSICILEEQEQCSLMNYCRYDLVKVKECITNLTDEHSLIEMQNRDLQLRVDALLRDISVALDNDSS
ncbi:JmjC domain-containing protein 4 [Stylophora pistillata]|uniref:Jumonji domain-containing protein 4 n=1 Tax=Stylophora pistillata TaxID=50429 RepID=A0A2B4S2J7_STYPI|nr:JmjC domain-containing protein 4 [Stylophora pistillata]